MEEQTNDEVPVWGIEEQTTNALHAAQGEGYDFLGRGGRDKTVCEWDFTPLVLPAQVNIDGHPQGAEVEDGFYTVTGNNGSPNLFVLLNPNIRTAKQPAGVYLSAVSSRYAVASYPEVFAPMMVHCVENGWDARITCYDKGKKARMDIDVTNFKGNKTNAKVGDLYRYGVSIHNSLDGTGSLRISGVAQRLICTNGMVATRSRNLMTLRHTVNGIGAVDFKVLAEAVANMVLEVEEELLFVERMRGYRIEEDMFERLLVAAREKGILTLPRAHAVKNKATDEVVDHTLSRGYLFRVAMQGWAQPEREWVKVEGESIGTAFHAYNVLTGGLTHKPIWTGPSTMSGEGNTTLAGRTLSLNALDNRLHAVHTLMKEVVQGSIELEDYSTPMEAMGIAA